MPGTMNQRLTRFGLNQARVSSCAGAAAPPCVARPVGVERGDDGADVAEQDRRRCSSCGRPRSPAPARSGPRSRSRLKVGPMCSTSSTPCASTSGAISSSCVSVATCRKLGEPLKRATRSRDAGPRVLVVDGERNVVQVERGRVAEHQQLQDRRHDDDHPALRLSFSRARNSLHHQRQDSPPHAPAYSRRLRDLRRLTPRKNAAITASASALGRITAHTLPARNTRLQDRHEIARREQVRDALHDRRHAADVEDEAREDEGRQEGGDDGHLAGDKLVLGHRGDEQPHAQRGQQEQRRRSRTAPTASRAAAHRTARRPSPPTAPCRPCPGRNRAPACPAAPRASSPASPAAPPSCRAPIRAPSPAPSAARRSGS